MVLRGGGDKYKSTTQNPGKKNGMVQKNSILSAYFVVRSNKIEINIEGRYDASRVTLRTSARGQTYSRRREASLSLLSPFGQIERARVPRRSSRGRRRMTTEERESSGGNCRAESVRAPEHQQNEQLITFGLRSVRKQADEIDDMLKYISLHQAKRSTTSRSGATF